MSQAEVENEGRNIWEEILAGALWVIENRLDIGRWWAIATNGVTNVKKWVNLTDQTIRVWKIDGSGRENAYTIGPNDEVYGEMWIPWADNPPQYASHHATIQVDDQPLAFFWQNGKNVRCSTSDDFVWDGAHVPGASASGGDRIMVFAKNPAGRLGFALAAFKEWPEI
ncbi:hypothetical protein HII36_34925 [Nonomuraea sp. NN258]|uniref:hypothetical protein n=1 Tax=Nonomuraea antri TaxID=2730852 RepID=UPI001567F50F|nr:hypothetical protein [Nonomuraea antri]NRQ36995.1 hypothetical protein [Nonomuraea antri]